MTPAGNIHDALAISIRPSRAKYLGISMFGDVPLNHPSYPLLRCTVRCVNCRKAADCVGTHAVAARHVTNAVSGFDLLLIIMTTFLWATRLTSNALSDGR